MCVIGVCGNVLSGDIAHFGTPYSAHAIIMVPPWDTPVLTPPTCTCMYMCVLTVFYRGFVHAQPRWVSPVRVVWRVYLGWYLDVPCHQMGVF